MPISVDTALDYLLMRTGSVTEVCRRTHINRRTYYAYLRRRREGRPLMYGPTRDKILTAFEALRAEERSDARIRIALGLPFGSSANGLNKPVDEETFAVDGNEDDEENQE